jgi:DNA ligase D-like protein (predicted 3'-phosphoesterase)
MPEKLGEYKKKRDFKKTPEPKGGKGTNGKPIFVVQKHDASHLHYDLRLEIDGVLKSWAVPKGPSLDPDKKRLAAMTEDHPIDYAEFEGVIPEGYGAGTVMVWDKGTYDNDTEKDGKELSAKDAVEKGHMSFKLYGKKMKGGWSLIHMKNRGKNWLLIKKNDDYADKRKKITNEEKSAKTGRTLKQIGKDES